MIFLSGHFSRPDKRKNTAITDIGQDANRHHSGYHVCHFVWDGLLLTVFMLWESRGECSAVTLLAISIQGIRWFIPRFGIILGRPLLTFDALMRAHWLKFNLVSSSGSYLMAGFGVIRWLPIPMGAVILSAANTLSACFSHFFYSNGYFRWIQLNNCEIFCKHNHR